MDEDEKRARRANVAVVGIVIVVIAVGVWLTGKLDQSKKSLECLQSGSPRCRIIDPQ